MSGLLVFNLTNCWIAPLESATNVSTWVCLLLYYQCGSHWWWYLSPCRWVTRSSRRSCCGSGWTAVWRRGGCWWLFRRAHDVATTLWSPRWWRSGWTGTGRSAPARLCLTERRRRTMKTSDRTEARRGRRSAGRGGAGLLPLLYLTVFFFLSWHGQTVKAFRRGQGTKPPPPLTGDTAALLSHAGTRTDTYKHVQHFTLKTLRLTNCCETKVYECKRPFDLFFKCKGIQDSRSIDVNACGCFKKSIRKYTSIYICSVWALRKAHFQIDLFDVSFSILRLGLLSFFFWMGRDKANKYYL